MAQQKEYAAVDVFKLICACLVILIHTKPFENSFWLDSIIGMLTRFAVPYFFTISGYFLFQRITVSEPRNKDKIIWDYLLRLIRFYVIWFVILRIFDYVLSGQSHSVRYYIKQFFFTTDGSALWFVEALIWATLIATFLSRWLNPLFITVIGVICLLVGYCFSTLLGITSQWRMVVFFKPFFDYIGIQGGIFFAFPYVAIGAFLSNKTLVPSIRRDVLLTSLFFLCLGIESIIMVIKLQAPFTFLWLSAAPMLWFTTRITLTIVIEEKPIYYIFRKISILCFVLHVPVFKLLQLWLIEKEIAKFDTFNLVLTGLTIATTISVAYVLLILSRNRKFLWLKYLM